MSEKEFAATYEEQLTDDFYEWGRAKYGRSGWNQFVRHQHALHVENGENHGDL